MKGRGLWLACALVAAATLTGGCHRGSTARDGSLARFNGALKLSLNVRRGDKFEYEQTEEVSYRAPSGNESWTGKATSVLEVVDRTPDGTRIDIADTGFSVESDDEALAHDHLRSLARLKGLRVEGFYDPTGATKSLTSNRIGRHAWKNAGNGLAGDPGLHGVVLPSGPVRVGSEWTAQVHITKSHVSLSPKSSSDEEIEVPITYKLIGAEERGGETLAVIQWNFDYETRDEGHVTGGFGGGTSPHPMRISNDGKARVYVKTGMVFDSTYVTTKTGSAGSSTRKTTLRLKRQF